MFTILSRIIHYGFKNFWRNGLLSTAMIAIMTLSLMVFSGLILANVATDKAVSFLKDKIDISVYFKNTAPEDNILSIQTALEGLPEVKSVEYISSDKALEIFKAEHTNDPAIIQSLDQLGANPFQGSLSIKAYSPDQYEKIDQYLKADALVQYIEKVNFAQSQTAIDKLSSLISGVNRAGLLLTIILTLIAGLVVYNTVRLAIYSNRDEIGVMRLVGASNVFVRGPYLIEGLIAGFFSAVISTVAILVLVGLVPWIFSQSASSEVALPGFSFNGYIYANIFKLFFYQLIFGVGVAMVSSFIAVRKYLRS